MRDLIKQWLGSQPASEAEAWAALERRIDGPRRRSPLAVLAAAALTIGLVVWGSSTQVELTEVYVARSDRPASEAVQIQVAIRRSRYERIVNVVVGALSSGSAGSAQQLGVRGYRARDQARLAGAGVVRVP